jgi:hypothetical protein
VLTTFGRRGILDRLRTGIGPTTLAREVGARPGPLSLGLRALASQGWLDGWAPRAELDSGWNPEMRLTDSGETVATALGTLAPRLDRIEAYLPHAEGLDGYLFEGRARHPDAPTNDEMLDLADGGWGLGRPALEHPHARLITMLDGVLASPLIVALARRRAFGRRGSGRQTEIADLLRLPDWLRLSGHRRFAREVMPTLLHLGWADGAGRLTPDGKLAALYASAYAVTTSYLPLLRRSDRMMFERWTFDAAFPRDERGDETHVDRPMNIWGSGGAHEIYFRTVDEVIVSLFSQPQHPMAICDTGCGDGHYLVHLYEVLRDRLRWDFFGDPIFFLGSDLNRQSRERTRETLAAAGVPNAYVVDVPVDISHPQSLAAGIEALNVPLRAGSTLTAEHALHTNSMLIHNRIYRPPTGPTELAATTDGAYIDVAGEAVSADALQQNLVEFMRAWAPLVSRYGWLFIELHTLPSAIVASDAGRTPTVAYDLTHGLSCQYTVEHGEVLAAARAAGLEPGPDEFQARFPNAEMPRVSITYLRGA